MAFTSTEQAQLRRYLGYPDLWRYKDTQLEGAMEVAGGDPDASTMVRADLASLVAIDAKILAYAQGGLKAVDEIEFYENGGLRSDRSRARMIVGRISTTLGVPLNADAYGEGGYPGDSFTGPGSTNMFRLG